MLETAKRSRLVLMDAGVAGPLFMLSAALLFTMNTILVKLLDPRYTVWHIGFFRFFGGVILLFSIFGRHTNLYRGQNIRLLIIRGCVGSAAFIAFISAVQMLPVSTVLVIFYTYPAFSAVFSFLLYGERIGRAEAACIATALAGIGVLLDISWGGGLAGQAMALLGGALAGLTVTFVKVLRSNHGPVTIYLYFCTMGTLVSLPQFAMHPILPATLVEGVMVLGIVLSTAIAQLLMNQGFFYCRGWEGGVFMSGEVVFTALVGIAFLHDPVTVRFWLGGLMVLGSGVALNRLRAHQEKHAAAVSL